MNGKRIVDISYFIEQVQNSEYEGGFGCNFNNMDFVSENRSGVYSEFWFICRMCNIKKKICSVKEFPTTNWSINKSLVNSTIAIGKF